MARDLFDGSTIEEQDGEPVGKDLFQEEPSGALKWMMRLANPIGAVLHEAGAGEAIVSDIKTGFADDARRKREKGYARANADAQAMLEKQQRSGTALELRQMAEADAARKKYDETGGALGRAGDMARDQALNLGKGIIGLGEAPVGLLDLQYGWTGHAPGKALQSLVGYDPKKAKDMLASFKSESGQTREKEIEDTEGFTGTLLRAVDDPAMIADAIVESLPGTVGTGAAASVAVKVALPKVAAMASAKGLTGAAADAFINKALGRVAVAASSGAEGAQQAGNLAESARQEGREWKDYAFPAIASGIGTGLISAGSGALARKFGVGDIESDIAMHSAGRKAGIKTDPGFFVNRMAIEGAKEGLSEEMLQSAQEAAWENIAMGRPWDQGLDKAAAMGLATGFGMGAGHAAIPNRSGTGQSAPMGRAPTATQPVPPGRTPAAAPTESAAPINQAALLAQLGDAPTTTPQFQDPFAVLANLDIIGQQQGRLTPEQTDMAQIALAQIEQQEAEDGVQAGSANATLAAQGDQEAGVDLLASADDLGAVDNGATGNAGQATGIAAAPIRQDDSTARAGVQGVETVRDANPRESTTASDAQEMLDLNRQPTGWKQIEYPNGGGVLLVSADGKKAVPFPSAKKSSGTEALRAAAKAQAFAIDNPYQMETPSGELVITPVFAPTPRMTEIDNRLSEIAADIPNRTEPVMASLRREAERLQQERVKEAQRAQAAKKAEPNTIDTAKDSMLAAINKAGGVDVQGVIEGMEFSESSTIQDVIDKAAPVVAANLSTKLSELIGEGNANAKELQQPAARETEEDSRTGSETAGARRGKTDEAAKAGGRDNQVRQGDEAGGKGNRAETEITTKKAQEQPSTPAASTVAPSDKLVTMRDVYGNTVRIKQADLDGAKNLLPMYHKNGRRYSGENAYIHRGNLDKDGSKQQALNAQAPVNLVWRTARGKDEAFATIAGAKLEASKRGLTKTHKVISAAEIQPGVKGYLLRRIETDSATPAPEPATVAPGSTQTSEGIATPKASAYRPLIEALINNKRNAKQFGFDLDGAIAKAKSAMIGAKQSPGSFRKLADQAEKKGDKETAGILRQIADMNDARKAKPQAEAKQVATEGAQENKEAAGQKTEKKESALHAALRSVGIDPNAPVSETKKLRREAEKIQKRAREMLAGIEPGQPIRTTADRNKRERAAELSRKAGALFDKADALERQEADSAPTTKETEKGVALFSRSDSLANGAEEITLESIGGNQDERAIDEAQRIFLSAFPERTRTYRRTNATARAAKASSDAARRSLGMDCGADRTVASLLGEFTGFTTRAKRTIGLDGKEQLLIQVYGKEQIEAGLDHAPALTMTLEADKDNRVEFAIYGPPSQSNLYKQFERRGWAEPARDADGNIIPTLDDGFWTKLSGSNREQAIELLGDAHARAREWLGVDHVGMYWKRTTGATGTTTGREGAIYFSQGQKGKGIPAAQLQTLVDRIAKQLRNMPAVHVFDSPLAENVPADLRAQIEEANGTQDVEGAMFDGELYLFAENLASLARAEHVLATHEITHVGLRGAVGKDLDPALRHVWVSNAKVRKAASELAKRLGIRSSLIAVEEVLADMPTSELIQLKGWRKVVQVVRNWLNSIGAKSLAKQLDDLLAGNLSEQERADLFVADLVTSAREWVKSGKPGPQAAMVATRLSDAKQEKWMAAEGRARGYKSIADLMARNNSLFEKLSELWQKKHEMAGVMMSRAKEALRTSGFNDKNSSIIADFKNDQPLKAHPDYKAAKAGDVDAAARLVQSLVKPGSIEAAKATFGSDAIYVSVHAEEASGKNQIPNMLALHYAAETGASIDSDITQKNRAFHTGANAMERLLARAEFEGKVESGRRYVLVDDVTTMGSTLAELANHIRNNGGEVVGSIVLVNAARSGMLKADRKTVRELEARHGEEISKLFGIEPGALTWSESQYLLGFRTTDELRNRVAKAKQERVDRLRSKGVLSGREDSQSPVAGQEASGEETGDTRFSRAGQQPFSSAPPAETKEQASRRVVQDAWNRFKHVQDWLKETGLQLSEQADVYHAEERYHGRVASRVEDFREKTVKPLIQKIQKAGFTMEQVGEFLQAQHAEERNIQIAKINPEFNLTDRPGSGMTTAEANAILAKTGPKLRALANEIRDITVSAKSLLLSSGIISQETADAWDATYQHYVPLKGDDSDTRQGTGQGKSVNGKEKRAMGHSARDEHIVENILRSYERAVVLSENNLMGQHLLTLALEANDPSLISIGKPEKRGVMMPGKAVHQVLYYGSPVAEFQNLNDARHFIDQQGKANMTISTVKGDPMVQYMASPQLQENEAQVYVLGQAVRVQINDPLMARAYKSLGMANLNTLLEAGREINAFLSKAYTGFNPYFLLRNMQRDFTTGIINITGNFGAGTALRAIKNYPKAFGHMLRYSMLGIETQDITDYRANGGSTGAAYLSDIERIGADVERSYNEYVGALELAKQGKKWAATKAAGGKTFGFLTNWITHLNSAGENAMRLALFNAIVEEGGSMAKAVSAAKNSTVNFNRRGEIGQQAGALYLFFNPNVQGTAILVDTLLRGEHKHQAQALAGGMVLTAFLTALMQFGGDDDEWDKIPESERSRNLIIRLPGGKRLNISVPYGWGIFHATGYALYDLTRGKDPEKVGKEMLSALFEHFSPMGDPMAGGGFSAASIANTVTPFEPARIISRMGTNQNNFGSQIVPESSFDKNKPDYLKMNRATRGSGYEWLATAMSDVTGGTKATAGMVDVSPETIKFLVNTLVGGTGTFVADVLKLAKMGTWDLARAETPEARAALIPETREVPFLNVMVRDSDVRDSRANFWEKAREAQAAASEFGRIRKERDREGLRKYSENREKRMLVALGRAADQYAKAASAKRDHIDRIKQDENMSVGQKRMVIRNIEREEARLYDKYTASFGLKMKKAKESSQ